MAKDKIKITIKNIIIILSILVCILAVYTFKKISTQKKLAEVEDSELALSTSNLTIENSEQNLINEISNQIPGEEIIVPKEQINEPEENKNTQKDNTKTSNSNVSSSKPQSGVTTSPTQSSNDYVPETPTETTVNNTPSADSVSPSVPTTSTNTSVETPVTPEPVKEKYTLYDFGYDGCYYCLVMDPIFDKYKNSYTNITFKKVDIYDSPDLASKYSVQYTPTFILVNNKGTIVDKIVGATSEDYFRNFLEKYK